MAFLRSSTIQELFYHARLLSLDNELLGYVLASVTSFISIRADIPPPVWVRQPETPGMTDRVDCVDLRTEICGHTGDTRVVWASSLCVTVSSGL
jgi:hypothetical protein